MKNSRIFFHVTFVLAITIIFGSFFMTCRAAAAAGKPESAPANASLNIDQKVAYIKNHTNLAVLNLKDGSEIIFPEKFSEIKAVALNSKKDKAVVAGKLKNDAGIYIADTADKKIVPLFEKKGVYFNSPSFSADGKFIAYTACKKDDPFSPADVMIYDIEKKSEKNVTNQKPPAGTGIYYNYPKFSADRKFIICSAANIPDLETPRYDTIFIVKVNALGNAPAETLTGGVTSYNDKGDQSGFKASVPTVLDDGRIGFLKLIDVDCALAVLDPSRNNEVTDLAANIENLSMPTFSKDGKYAAFEIFNDDEKNPGSSINIIDFSTKSVRKIAENGYKPAL